MKNLDTIVCYKHKETGICIDMKYIKYNKRKTLRLCEGLYRVCDKEYIISDIPYSKEWEMKLYYFKPSEYNRLMVGDIDKELNEKIVSLIDERIIKYEK